MYLILRTFLHILQSKIECPFMKKVLTVAIFLLFTQVGVMAQQDPQFSQYAFNHLFLNPAAAGSENQTKIQAIYRYQYLGYTGTFDKGGSPITQMVSANIPLNMIKSGVGIHFVNDQLGGGNIGREFQLSYAYKIPVGGSQLALGVSSGFHTQAIDYDVLRPRDQDDPLIGSGKVSQTKPDIGAGVYLYNSGYTLGLSMKHINQPTFGLGTQLAKNPLNRSLYLTGSFLIGVSYTLDITPIFVIKSDMKTISPEAGAIATYDNRFWAGVNYRWQDAASLLVGTTFLNNSMRIGYAFDWITAGVYAKSTTSHEILLSYVLAPPRAGKKSIIRTPRYRY